MKQIIATFGLLLLSSCASTYVREWHDGQVTICGNKWATETKLKQDAEAKCGSAATAISGGTVDSGAVAGSNGFGGIYIKNTRDECTTFKCAGHSPASQP